MSVACGRYCPTVLTKCEPGTTIGVQIIQLKHFKSVESETYGIKDTLQMILFSECLRKLTHSLE